MAANNTKGYLICLDYDQTIGKTFQRSPNGIGVNEAYRYAIESIFGQKGLFVYDQIGGLQNRAPGELIEALLANGNRKQMVQNARVFYQKHLLWLNNLAADGKFVIPEWTKRSAKRETEEAISELLILQKLFYLMKEIGSSFPDGKIWPEPCTGILDFFQTIRKINSQGKISIQLAILSSGHTEFVKKTFEVWKAECPEILITDDDVRMLPIELKDKVKPSKFLFGLIYTSWIKKYGPISIIMPEISEEDRPRIIYFGDDPIKDGKLAKMTDILFGWFNPEKKQNNELDKNKTFSFGNWNEIAGLLKQKNVLESLQKGEPLAKIFSPLILQN